MSVACFCLHWSSKCLPQGKSAAFQPTRPPDLKPSLPDWSLEVTKVISIRSTFVLFPQLVQNQSGKECYLLRLLQRPQHYSSILLELDLWSFCFVLFLDATIAEKGLQAGASGLSWLNQVPLLSNFCHFPVGLTSPWISPAYGSLLSFSCLTVYRGATELECFLMLGWHGQNECLPMRLKFHHLLLLEVGPAGLRCQ